ncbi:MAG TPA: YybH family protein [Elainellaceae cyanobacterium]
MTIGNRNRAEEVQIRQRINTWIAALRAKDVDALMAHYAPNLLLYDLDPPLVHHGADTYRKSWQEWFASIQGDVGYEIRNLSLSVGDDVAFSTSVNQMSGMQITGEQFNIWVRMTVGYRKQDDQWRVVHEHISVPFYMDGSFKAAVDLEP